MSIYDASPYLAGNYAPVAEEVTAVDLAVTGSIPSELEGRYVRNGSNPPSTPDMQNHHWFLGQGMVHGRDSLPRLARWTVDPTTQSVKRETLDDDVQEFPRVSDAVANLPYRYGYTSGGVTKGVDWFGTTIKHDLTADTRVVREHGDRREPGEPVFVERENATAEDDGWLMMYVYDPGRNGSDLVILDATDITGDEVARIELPQRVPNGFHGDWISD